MSGGISGGHINPAVTLAFAVMRDFPWRKVPVFFLAQFLGAFCGAAIIYGNYLGAIDIQEGGGARTVPGTASLFATYPVSPIVYRSLAIMLIHSTVGLHDEHSLLLRRVPRHSCPTHHRLRCD